MVGAGYTQSVRWGNETSYGSMAPVNKDLGAVQSIAPGEKNNLIKIRTLGGNRDYKTVLPGKFEISGSMDYFLQGGDFLRQAFGEDTATTAVVDSGPRIPAAGLYLHVMGSATSPAVLDFPSFSLEFTDYESDSDTGSVNLKRTYTGCRVNSLSISAGIDEPVKCSCDWMAKRVEATSAVKTSITEYTTDPFVFYDGFVYLTSGAVTAETTPTSLKADAICEVNTFNFSVNNNAEAVWYVGGTCSAYDSARSAKYIIPKGRDYDLKLGLHYSSRVMYERFLGSLGASSDQKTLDKSQIVLDMVKTGVPGTPVVGDHWMRLVVASALFDDIAINGSPEDIINNDVTVFGKKVKCYFTDNVETYK